MKSVVKVSLGLITVLSSLSMCSLAFADTNADAIQKWTGVAVETLVKENPDLAAKTTGARVLLNAAGAKVTFTTADPAKSVTYSCHNMGGMDMCM